MADSSPTAHAITKAVGTSLNLVNTSTQLLSLAQLLATKSELLRTLAVVDDEIQARFSVSPTVTIDLTGWDSASDEEEEDKHEGTDAANAADSSKGKNQLPQIPGPYPMDPPKRDVLPDCWYVVDRGTRVGIFSNGCADFFVAGVVGGHKVEVKSWSEAATLYNELYRQGKVILATDR